jgi:hypothetical protein
MPVKAAVPLPSSAESARHEARGALRSAKKKPPGGGGFQGQSLVPVTGIELVTFALRMRCSTN